MVEEMRARSRAVVQELITREISDTLVEWSDNFDSGPPCAAAPGDGEGIEARRASLLTQVFVERCALLEREQRKPAARISKQPPGELLTVSRVATYCDGDLEFALPAQRSTKKRQDTKRYARQHKNFRKKQIFAYFRNID